MRWLRHVKNEEEITADVFAEMITASVEGIQDISPAQVGDKSLLDTLIPAKEAFVEAKEAGKDFAECLDAMNAAAEKRMAVYKRSCSQDRTSKPPWRTLSRCS